MAAFKRGNVIVVSEDTPINRNTAFTTTRRSGGIYGTQNRYRNRREIRPVTKSLLDREIKGEAFRPPLVPTVFSTNPWHNVTVRVKVTLDGKAAKQLKIGDLAAALLQQTGLITTDSPAKLPAIEYRINSFMAWHVGNGEFLRVMPLNFSTASEFELYSCDAMGQKNMYAAVGFTWPYAQSMTVFKQTTTNSGAVVVSIDGSTGDVELHFKMLFRGGIPQVLTRTWEYEMLTPCETIDKDHIQEEFHTVFKQIQKYRTNPKTWKSFAKTLINELKEIEGEIGVKEGLDENYSSAEEL